MVRTPSGTTFYVEEEKVSGNFGRTTSFAANADGDYILWEDVERGSNPAPTTTAVSWGSVMVSTRKLVSVNLGRRSFFPPMEVAASHGGSGVKIPPPDAGVIADVAQLEEHLSCKQKVIGSIPIISSKRP